MSTPIYFVSGNEQKVKEAKHILGVPLKIVSIDLPEIQSLDIEKIVSQKAVEAYRRIKKPVIVDDTGVYVKAWKGFPGPLLKFIIKTGGNKMMLKMLGRERNRKADFVSAVGYFDGQDVKVFTGKVTGSLTYKPRVANDSRVDSIFIPDGRKKTYAQMSVEEKSLISHRRKSLEKLKKYLRGKQII